MAVAEILIVDDDEAIRTSFSHYLRRVGFSVQTGADLGTARDLLGQRVYDALLLDLALPDGNGLDAIIEFKETWPEMSLIVVTGTNEIPVAVEAMRRGADHYLAKPVDMKDLEVLLCRCTELGYLRRQNVVQRRLSPELGEPFFGESQVMQDLRRLVDLAAQNDAPVLLQGETGTGKGILARWIHRRSARKRGHFVDVNCSSLQGEILSSELFGHARGAFTSAASAREGLLELAHAGTLFLDEIGDMVPAVQCHFLKVLEDKRFRRMGENIERHSDFRILCATNRDLAHEVERGRFRRDLYYRLNTLSLQVPPLRDRSEDVPELLKRLLKDLGAEGRELSPAALTHLQAYAWPGNVREMKNLLERALLLHPQGALPVSAFPGVDLPKGESGGHGGRRSLSERQARAALSKACGRVEGAARLLGVSRATLYRRLKEWGIKSNEKS